MSIRKTELGLEFGFDMNTAIDDVVEKLAKDAQFNSLFTSILHNFKEKVQVQDKEGMLVYALIVGYIFNDIWRKRDSIIGECEQNDLLKELLKRKEDMEFYECELENGEKFVLSTNNKEVVDNQMVKIIKEKTGSNPISPLRKLNEKEKKEQIEIIVNSITGKEKE